MIFQVIQDPGPLVIEVVGIVNVPPFHKASGGIMKDIARKLPVGNGVGNISVPVRCGCLYDIVNNGLFPFT